MSGAVGCRDEQNMMVLTQLLKVELILLSTGRALFLRRNFSIFHIHSGNLSPSDNACNSSSASALSSRVPMHLSTDRRWELDWGN